MFAVFDAPDNEPSVSTHNLESPLINAGFYYFACWYIMPSMNSRLHVYLRDSNSNLTLFDHIGQVPDWMLENSTIYLKEQSTVRQ